MGTQQFRAFEKIGRNCTRMFVNEKFFSLSINVGMCQRICGSDFRGLPAILNDTKAFETTDQPSGASTVSNKFSIDEVKSFSVASATHGEFEHDLSIHPSINNNSANAASENIETLKHLAQSPEISHFPTVIDFRWLGNFARKQYIHCFRC